MEIILSGHNTNILIGPAQSALISWHNIVSSQTQTHVTQIVGAFRCSILDARQGIILFIMLKPIEILVFVKQID